MNYEKLDNLCEINIGKTPSRNNENYWNGQNNWIAISDMNDKYVSKTKQKISNLAIDECNMKIINSGTVIMSFKLTIGKVAITAEDIYSNEAIASFNIKNSSILDKNYLYYALQTINYSKNTDRAVMGVTLNKAKLKQLVIPLPSIGIQKKISKTLDLAQSLIEKRKEQLIGMDRLIQSVFYEIFGDPKLNIKEFPLSYLDSLCNKITDGTHHSPTNVTEGIPYVTAKHLSKGYFDFFEKPTYISKSDHQKIYSRCNPEKGDVLFVKDGSTTGIAAINKYDFEFSMLSSLALIKTSKHLNSIYLVNYLNFPSIKDTVVGTMSGGAIKRLTIKKIKHLEVVVPPIELQNKFATIVEEIESQKKVMEQSLTEMENNFNALMQKAFKGELFSE